MSAFSQAKNNVSNSLNSRLNIDYLLDVKALEKDDAQDVINGFKNIPKSIPARYFYDAKGSQLFEKICELPEYYPTRTEASILEQYALEIASQAQVNELIELGSGSSTKTRYLLDAYQNTQADLIYGPVDVSDSILKASAIALLKNYPQLTIQGKVATYDQALQRLKPKSSRSKMIIFLGSSIGNFAPDECDRFLAQVTKALNPGDYFLLGIDLQKQKNVLEAAYNDAQGITAAFNLNMLQHLNHRFGGNFNSDLFSHQAVYNSVEHQIEMYLTSQKDQTVTLKDIGLNIDIKQSEKILTEISRKFNLEAMQEYLSRFNFNTIHAYTDAQQKFGLMLLKIRNR